MVSELIKSRADFHRVLTDTIDLVKRLSVQSPGYPVFATILRQLQAMDGWTANRRVPAEAERRSINVGLIAVRELDSDPDRTVQDLATRLHELNYCFDQWPATW